MREAAYGERGDGRVHAVQNGEPGRGRHGVKQQMRKELKPVGSRPHHAVRQGHNPPKGNRGTDRIAYLLPGKRDAGMEGSILREPHEPCERPGMQPCVG